MAKRRYSKKEMEKIYRRRRILVSFIAMVIVVLIGYGIYGIVNLFIPKDSEKDIEETKQTEQENTENEIDNENGIVVNDASFTEQAPTQIGNLTDWNLILANPDTPLPEDFEVETAVVEGAMEVDTRIVDTAKKMLDDAKDDGIDLMVCSGYRSVQKQQNLFDNSISTYKAKGYSESEAIKFTKAYYAVPGTSEHHTGLAMDIVTPSYQSLDDKYAETDAAKWMFDNAHKYGFILRYPKDKEDITKISYEPWHYRYVGEEHAKIIEENNYCLEEYLNTFEK